MSNFHSGQRVRWRNDLPAERSSFVTRFQKQYGDEVTISRIWGVSKNDQQQAWHPQDMIIVGDNGQEGHFSGSWFEAVEDRAQAL